MNTSTVSSKYQVVVPRNIREKITLTPGQTVQMEATPEGDIIIRTHSVAKSLYGRFRSTWDGQGSAHIDELRKEADCDRAR